MPISPMSRVMLMSENPHDPIIVPITANPSCFAFGSLMDKATRCVAADCALVVRQDMQIDSMQPQFSEGMIKGQANCFPPNTTPEMSFCK